MARSVVGRQTAGRKKRAQKAREGKPGKDSRSAKDDGLLRENQLVRDGIIEEMPPTLRACALKKEITFEGRQYEITGMTEAELADNARLLMQRLRAGEYEDPTLDEYFEEWILRKEMTLSKQVTAYRYRQFYRNHLHRRMGARKLRELKRRDVIRLQTDLLEVLGPSTVNYAIQLLKSILADAAADEIILRNPANKIRRLENTGTAASETTHRALTEEEQAAFLKAAEGNWYYEFFAFLLCTGLRQGEAAALTWGDIDIPGNVICIRKTLTFDRDGHVIIGAPKTRAGIRDVPMNAGIRRVLDSERAKLQEMWGAEALTPESRVFPSSIGGTLQNSTANIVLRRILNQMKEDGIEIERFSCHALRDTFATRFIEQGGTPQTLKTILGHASLKMTMDLYAHVLPSTRQKEMDQVRIEV